MVNGTVYSTGYNSNGQLGHGNAQCVNKGKKIDGLENIVDIATGKEFAIFLSNDSRLFGTGESIGQFPGEQSTLFNGNKHYTPFELTHFNDMGIKITQIRSTLLGMFFVSKKRQVYKCGRVLGRRSPHFSLHNYYEKEEKDDFKGGETFHIPRMSNFEFISSGEARCLVVKKHRKLLVIGNNFDNQQNEYSRFGMGAKTDIVKEPTEIKSLRNKSIVHVVTSRNNTYAITSKGDIYAVGSGEDGQMGNGFKKSTHEFELMKFVRVDGSKRISPYLERMTFLVETKNVFEVINLLSEK